MSDIDYFNLILVLIGTLIAVASLIFTVLIYFRDQPDLIVIFNDSPVFFHPKDMTKLEEPDWFSFSTMLSNNGTQPISIVEVEFLALIGNDQIPGFRIDKLLSGVEDPEVPFIISSGGSKKIHFSFGMSGLGRAKEFEMHWRNLPKTAKFEFLIKDVTGEKYLHTFNLESCTKIDLETAQEYQSVLNS